MRQGNEPKLQLDRKGDIMAFATGSDFCAEHEVGSKELMLSLCGAYETNEELARKHGPSIRAGKRVDLPSVLAERTITRPELLKESG